MERNLIQVFNSERTAEIMAVPDYFLALLSGAHEACTMVFRSAVFKRAVGPVPETSRIDTFNLCLHTLQQRMLQRNAYAQITRPVNPAAAIAQGNRIGDAQVQGSIDGYRLAYVTLLLLDELHFNWDELTDTVYIAWQQAITQAYYVLRGAYGSGYLDMSLSTAQVEEARRLMQLVANVESIAGPLNAAVDVRYDGHPPKETRLYYDLGTAILRDLIHSCGVEGTFTIRLVNGSLDIGDDVNWRALARNEEIRAAIPISGYTREHVARALYNYRSQHMRRFYR